MSTAIPVISYICEVAECEFVAEFNCCHPPFYVKDRSPSDKDHTYFCEAHADDAVNISTAMGMPINITELKAPIERDFPKV